MKLNEPEMRMVYQIESTDQVSVLNEPAATWRYALKKETKDTAKSLLAKLRPLTDKECMGLVREVQKNYRLPDEAKTIGELCAGQPFL